MDIEPKVELLKKIDFLSLPQESTLRQLCEHCGKIVLELDDMLFEEDLVDNAMYLILSREIIAQ